VKNVATADDGRRLLNVEITATNESGMTIIIDQVSIRNPIICVFDSGGRMTEATRTGFVSLGSQSGEATSYESLEDGGSVTLDLPITIERALDGDTVITNLTHSWTLKRGKDYTLVAIVESLVDSPLFRKGVPVSALSIRKATGNPVMGLSVSSPIIVSEKHLSELDKGMQGQSDKAIWK
jgi:hypothetical protein